MFGCVGYIFLSIVELAIVGMLEKPTALRSRESIEKDIIDGTNPFLNESRSRSKRLFRESHRRKVRQRNSSLTVNTVKIVSFKF